MGREELRVPDGLRLSLRGRSLATFNRINRATPSSPMPSAVAASVINCFSTGPSAECATGRSSDPLGFSVVFPWQYYCNKNSEVNS